MWIKKLGLIIGFVTTSLFTVTSYAFLVTNLDNKSSYEVEQAFHNCVPGQCFKGKLGPLAPYNAAACKWDVSGCNCTGQKNACVKLKITNLVSKVSCSQMFNADADIKITGTGIKAGDCGIAVSESSCDPAASCQNSQGY